MGIFSKFCENVVDQKENADEKNNVDHNEGESTSSKTDLASITSPEKSLIESVGEILQNSATNVKEAVFGSASDGDIESLPSALTMEDPFSQSDNVLAAVVERDVRLSSDGHEDDAKGKTIVQTVRENLAYSAHIVRDTVLGHSPVAEPNGKRLAQVASPVEEDNNGCKDEHGRTIIEAMGELVSHPVQTVKDIIGSHNNVAESSSIDSNFSNEERKVLDDGDDRKKTVVENVSEMLTQSVETVKEAVLRHTSVDRGDIHGERSATFKPEPSSTNDSGRPEEPVEIGEVKGLMQSVKDVAHEVKEEVMEAVQEVKDAVLSGDTLPNVPESITEDAGERPSMELVHTIVHD